MPELQKHTIDAGRLLTSARAWGAAFPQFADLVTRIEARLLVAPPELQVVARFEVARFGDT